MSKTSSSQLEMLVDFMERNGDLSKPTTKEPNGRLTNMKLWEELSNILNADATGATKETEKWRKVWSDLKNNTKRKKSRILQSTNATGGGTGSKLELTSLENRVLNIIGPQAATGIPVVPEVGLAEEIIIPAEPSTAQILPPSPAQASFEPYVEDLHQSPVADSPQTPISRRLITPRGRLTPRRSPLEHQQRRRDRLQTERRRPTPRRRRLDARSTTSPVVPARRARLTHTERARQALLESDREWRAFFLNREQEANRLREMELAQQAKWQELFAAFLVTLNTGIEVLQNRNT